MAPVVLTTSFALLAAVAVVLGALLVTGRDGSPATFLANLRGGLDRRRAGASQAPSARGQRSRGRRPGVLAEMRELADVEEGDIDDLFHVGSAAPAGYVDTAELQRTLDHVRRVAGSAGSVARRR